MSNIQDEYLQKHVSAAQITNTIRLSRLFLISIMIVSIYIYGIYQFYFTKDSSYFDLWFIVTEILCCLALLITTLYFKPHTFSLKCSNRWLQFQLFVIGNCIATGIALLYYYLPEYNQNFSHVHGLILSALLMIVSQAFALTFLTQRLNYFCWAFIPTILPYFVSQFMPGESYSYLFYLSINFILIVTLLCGNISTRIHQRISLLYTKNNRLVRNAEQQVLWSDELCKQLQTEINKSKDIEQQLKLNNQLLEQKVKERTFDIAQMNNHLENQQHNLMLAHQTAGLRPWDWNITDREILVTDYKYQKVLKPSKQHHYQLQNIIHPDDLSTFKSLLKQHLRGQTDLYEASYRVKNSQGTWKWVHDSGRVISRHPVNQKPLRMVGIRRDIHQERLDQERIKLAASVFKKAAEGIFILDEHLCFLQVNPFYEQITGFSHHDILGKYLFDISKNCESHLNSTQDLLLHQLQQKGEFDGEMNEKFLSGKELTLWVHINAVTNEKNQVTHYIGIVSDLTERKRQEQRLSYLENYDLLTDLPNRFYYSEQLHQYLVNPQESIQQLAIIHIDIDRFRPLNEFLSNSGGNELLRQVAQRLRQTNIEALTLAYLNGDKFALVYEYLPTQTSIQQYCTQISEAFCLPFNIFGQDHIITLSMGVAFYPEHGRQVDYLNNCAEQALTEAKSLGGNTVCYYSNHNKSLPAHDTYLERDLRRAIHNNELIVYYQPKMNFIDQKIYGFEALVRWNHPTKGIIPPNLFIPLAEQTSLISDIGKIVIQQTAQQIRQWNDAGFPYICVSVNVVAQQLQRGQLLEVLDNAIEKYKISGSSLVLEITESSLLENSTKVKTLLGEIKKRGIKIALDDFGTGYSSLSYLADFPIDILKIDRSFISKIGENKQEAIVSAMIAMGKAMGLVVVAEGIETTQQMEYLHGLKCDIAQGYLFSKPLPENEATLFLERHRLIPS